MGRFRQGNGRTVVQSCRTFYPSICEYCPDTNTADHIYTRATEKVSRRSIRARGRAAHQLVRLSILARRATAGPAKRVVESADREKT